MQIGFIPGTNIAGNYSSPNVITIFDYARTAWYKAATGLSGWDNNNAANTPGMSMHSGYWLNTAVITSLTFGINYSGAVFTAGSLISIYGE